MFVVRCHLLYSTKNELYFFLLYGKQGRSGLDVYWCVGGWKLCV